jgi:uncharacterized integral membrane protein
MVFSTMLPATGIVMTYRDRGWTWLSVGLGCVTLLGLGGILETFVFRVQLTDEALVVTDLRGRRSYPMEGIAGVHEAKGVSTTLLLSDGRKVNLPEVGRSLGNSIRAWLKYSSQQ